VISAEYRYFVKVQMQFIKFLKASH